MKKHVLNVAMDFSGINAPLHALDRMGIQYRLIFSCDNDTHCKSQILAHRAPICFFDDIKDTKTRFNHFPFIDALSTLQRFNGTSHSTGKKLQNQRKHRSIETCTDNDQKITPKGCDL